MKPLLAVLLPVKGVVRRLRCRGYRSECSRGNSKSALLGTVCGVSGFIPTFIRHGTSVRTTCSGLASESCWIVPRTRGVLQRVLRLRAESQLNYAKPLTIYDSAKKPISQTKWTNLAYSGPRVFGIRFDIQFPEGAEIEIDGRPQAKLRVRST